VANAWTDLTPEEQAIVQDYVNVCRGNAIAFETLIKQQTSISSSWTATLSTILQGMDPAAVIPNTSSLAGAQSLTASDAINWSVYCVDISNDQNTTSGGGYNTSFHQGLRSKLAGLNAIVGA
jgi:hypothetical protein